MFCHVVVLCVNMPLLALFTAPVAMLCYIDEDKEMEEEAKEDDLDHPTLGTFSNTSIKNVHFIILPGNRVAGRRLCAITTLCVHPCMQVRVVCLRLIDTRHCFILYSLD